MRKAIERAQQKLHRSSKLLDYRRLNWRVETNHRIRWEFEKFVRIARESGLQFEFNIRQHDAPNEGVIQMTAQHSLTGVVHRKCNFDGLDETSIDTSDVETGGDLVASQSSTGHIHFIAHPRTSDGLKATKSEYIILGPLDPTEVTVDVIQKVLRQYLIILQGTSNIGIKNALTFWERVEFFRIRFNELRNRHDTYRSILSLKSEWAKWGARGLLTFVVGYLTGKAI